MYAIAKYDTAKLDEYFDGIAFDDNRVQYYDERNPQRPATYTGAAPPFLPGQVMIRLHICISYIILEYNTPCSTQIYTASEGYAQRREILLLQHHDYFCVKLGGGGWFITQEIEMWKGPVHEHSSTKLEFIYTRCDLVLLIFKWNMQWSMQE